jgi:dihydrofolate synthase / folylpolyglutamate synthase
VNFREAESYLLSLGNEVETMKLGLDNIRKLLAALGDPQTNYLKVQVAGTNGKGSVCAFLDSICLQAGIKTGVFTSPHLVSMTERVRIEGVDISEADFARHASVVRDTAETLLADGAVEYLSTFFEQVTAIALRAFAESKVELAILETGLGGRLDATTAANAEIAAITRIDLDHQEYLGDTIEKIAAEKAAIIRGDSKVIALHQSRPAENAIIGRCREVGVEPVWATRDYITGVVDDLKQYAGHVFTFKTEKANYSDIEPQILGRHQGENASVAISIAEVLQDERFNISTFDIDIGLCTAHHPGRLEWIRHYLLDGAHNIAGAKRLREFLDEFVTKPITLIFGTMKDKDVAGFAEIVFPIVDHVVLTRIDNARSMTAGEIVAAIPDLIDKNKRYETANVAEALKKANEVVDENGLIVVTGSLYLIGEVKKLLKFEI